jgi:serine/threonine-protein kinase
VPDRAIWQAFARELSGPLLEEITVIPASALVDATPLRAPRVPAPGSPQRRDHAPDADDETRERAQLETAGRDAEATAPAPRSRLSLDVRVQDAASRPVLGRRYVLLEELGRGGMGIVYLSWDLVLQRSVAVKVVRGDRAEATSLKQEATAAFELNHPSIVRTYHFEPARADTASFLVMEYLRWPSGEKWIADAGIGGLPARAVARVGARIAEALAYAHSQRLLHLDIKPSNIFVDPGGESAKLGDFGLARVTSGSGSTLQLAPAGTPAYMAPEQREHGATITSATDVYQFGATLWDFATGGPPKRGDLGNGSSDASPRGKILQVAKAALSSVPSDRPTASELAVRLAQAV